MEIEAKYSLPNRATWEQLLTLRSLAGFDLHEAGDEQVTDHYLDTPARAIAANGYALRLRQVAFQAEWVATLKSLVRAEGALHRREEYEVSVPSAALPAAWPASPARDLALRLAGDEPLEVLFVLEQTRHRRQARQDERVAAELSFDAVAISAQPGEALIYELEIELRPAGTLAEVQALGAALAGYGLQPQPLSKFARALALVDAGDLPAPPAARPRTPGVRADEPMAEAGRKVLRFHFQRMLAQAAEARAGTDQRPVHAMRVAARRQRAALRLFGDGYKPKTLRPIRAGLQTLAGTLGAVRDLDVLRAGARDYQARLPAAEAASLEPLLETWAAEQEAARAALVEHLDSADYARFKDVYTEFLETEGAGVSRATGGVRPELVRQVLPARLWEHYAAVRAYETALPGAPLETVHALRLEAKRLRYTLEFLQEALDPAAAEAIAAVVALQDHLGALQDLDVTIDRLSAFDAGLGKRTTQPDVRQAVRAYQRYQRVRLRSLRRTLDQPWRVVNSGRFRKLLGRVASRL